MNTIVDRIKRTIYGQAIGDALGLGTDSQDRYKSGRDRDAIALAFSNSIVSDLQWVKNQEKKQTK